MDVLGRGRSERLVELPVQILVRPVVVAADDVRDAELGVVDDAREVVGRSAVLAEERDPAEAVAEQALGGFAVAVLAFALAHRPLVPGEAEPLEVARSASSPPGMFRAASVSSIRRSIQSPSRG